MQSHMLPENNHLSPVNPPDLKTVLENAEAYHIKRDYLNTYASYQHALATLGDRMTDAQRFECHLGLFASRLFLHTQDLSTLLERYKTLMEEYQNLLTQPFQYEIKELARRMDLISNQLIEQAHYGYAYAAAIDDFSSYASPSEDSNVDLTAQSKRTIWKQMFGVSDSNTELKLLIAARQALLESKSIYEILKHKHSIRECDDLLISTLESLADKYADNAFAPTCEHQEETLLKAAETYQELMDFLTTLQKEVPIEIYLSKVNMYEELAKCTGNKKYSAAIKECINENKIFTKAKYIKDETERKKVRDEILTYVRFYNEFPIKQQETVKNREEELAITPPRANAETALTTNLPPSAINPTILDIPQASGESLEEDNSVSAQPSEINMQDLVIPEVTKKIPETNQSSLHNSPITLPLKKRKIQPDLLPQAQQSPQQTTLPESNKQNNNIAPPLPVALSPQSFFTQPPIAQPRPTIRANLPSSSQFDEVMKQAHCKTVRTFNQTMKFLSGAFNNPSPQQLNQLLREMARAHRKNPRELHLADSSIDTDHSYQLAQKLYESAIALADGTTARKELEELRKQMHCTNSDIEASEGRIQAYKNTFRQQKFRLFSSALQEYIQTVGKHFPKQFHAILYHTLNEWHNDKFIHLLHLSEGEKLKFTSVLIDAKKILHKTMDDLNSHKTLQFRQ